MFVRERGGLSTTAWCIWEKKMQFPFVKIDLSGESFCTLYYVSEEWDMHSIPVKMVKFDDHPYVSSQVSSIDTVLVFGASGCGFQSCQYQCSSEN